jgi:hypothetical protein
MPFEGIKDARVRADLLAFLKDATKPGAVSQQTAQQGGMGGMMGGMMGGRRPRSQFEKLRAEHAGEGDHLLPRQLSSDHG